MYIINEHIQVYNVWVNGRDKENTNNHFPIDCNIDNYNIWHTDLKKAVDDYFNVVINDADDENGLYSEIYVDYHVALYSIDIDIEEFKRMYKMEFDITNDKVQDIIPYYVDYNFNVVAERIGHFKEVSI